MKHFAKWSWNRVRALFLALVLLFGMLTLNSVPPPLDAFAAETEYQLVTDASKLSVGDKVVIAAAGYDVALSTTQNKNNRGQATITKNGNTMSFEDTAGVQILTLEKDTTDGTFAFNTGSGYLYAASGSSNYLRTETTLSDNGSWTIEIAADGVATLLAQGNNTNNYLQYNQSSKLFSCYAPTKPQKDVVLYKYVGCPHQWVEDGEEGEGWTTTTPAECEIEGEETRTCHLDGCGEVETRPIPALEHDWSEWENTTSATCVTGGEETRTCTLCSGKEKQSIDALGHDWSDWVETIPAGCETEGSKTRTCKNCPETQTEVIDALGHSWGDVTVTKEPTCTEPGTQSATCTVCQTKDSDAEIPAKGHTWSEEYTVLTSATCTEAGVQTQICEDCATENPETVEIPATGHSFNSIGVCTAATCGIAMPIYTKVTSAPTDWSGTYLIVYESTEGNFAFNGNLTDLDSTNNGVSVDISNSQIVLEEKYAFTIAAIEGGYSIQSTSGFYIGKTSDGNGMNTNNDTAYTNTISLAADGSVTIVGSGGAYLRYNAASNQARFRYFKSETYTNQKAIALYKLDTTLQSFKDTKTFTSLKTNATDGDDNVTDVSLRFGMRQLDAELYNALDAAGATFGVELTLNGNTVYREEGGTWVPAIDGNGYSFSIVIDNLAGRWDKEITARVYVKFGETKHYMQSATYSVNSLVKALGATINGSIILPNTPAALKAVQAMNKEVA